MTVHNFPPMSSEPPVVDQPTTLRVVGKVVLYLTFAPPIAVALWRFAIEGVWW